MAKTDKHQDTPKLTAAEYWEWRTTIAEMQKGDVKLQHVNAEAQVLRKEAEIVGMRYQLFQKVQVQNAKDQSKLLKEEYDSMKKRLEDRLGFSLNNKMIDEITFEVKDLPDSNDLQNP
ncbi:MAG: hypothetical protein H7836_04475 [Magnetococcus sp. YQC-3]